MSVFVTEQAALTGCVAEMARTALFRAVLRALAPPLADLTSSSLGKRRRRRRASDLSGETNRPSLSRVAA